VNDPGRTAKVASDEGGSTRDIVVIVVIHCAGPTWPDDG